MGFYYVETHKMDSSSSSCQCRDALEVDTTFGSVVSRGPFSTLPQQADRLLSFHAIHWVLSTEAYATIRRNEIAGWLYQPEQSSPDTAVYRHQSLPHVIVAFRGSQTLVDIHNDIVLSRPGNSCSFPKAEFMSQWVSSLLEEPDILIQLTGHSLGGAIARCVGGRLGLGAVTFNAAAPPSSPAATFPNQIHYHIVFDVISAWQTNAIRINKGFQPAPFKRWPLFNRVVQKWFRIKAIGPMVAAHELSNFSDERAGQLVTAEKEEGDWQNWFIELPTRLKKLFLSFIRTTEGLPQIPN